MIARLASLHANRAAPRCWHVSTTLDQDAHLRLHASNGKNKMLNKSVTFLFIMLALLCQACGRIRHNKLVYFDGDGDKLRGQLVQVRIDKCNAYSLYGTLCD